MLWERGGDSAIIRDLAPDERRRGTEDEYRR